jgi:ribosomal protein L29
MKIEELKKKSHSELKTLLSEKKNSLRAFHFAVAGSKTRNIKEGSALRKDIARIKTILNEEK